jgi:hypothetical protein
MCKQLSLALAAVLMSKDQALTIMGFVCSSWISISKGTSARTFMSPLGDTSIPFVAQGNMMLSRSPSCFNEWLFSSSSMLGKTKSFIWIFWYTQGDIAMLPDSRNAWLLSTRTTRVIMCIPPPTVPGNAQNTEGAHTSLLYFTLAYNLPTLC